MIIEISILYKNIKAIQFKREDGSPLCIKATEALFFDPLLNFFWIDFLSLACNDYITFLNRLKTTVAQSIFIIFYQ